MRVFRECLSTFVCVLLSLLGIEGGMWDVIILIPDHCLSIYFVLAEYDSFFQNYVILSFILVDFTILTLSVRKQLANNILLNTAFDNCIETLHRCN